VADSSPSVTDWMQAWGTLGSFAGFVLLAAWQVAGTLGQNKRALAERVTAWLEVVPSIINMGTAVRLATPEIVIKNGSTEPVFDVAVLVQVTSKLLPGGAVVCAWPARAPLRPESEKRVLLTDFKPGIGDADQVKNAAVVLGREVDQGWPTDEEGVPVEFEMSVSFVDARGRHWERDQRGSLRYDRAASWRSRGITLLRLRPLGRLGGGRAGRRGRMPHGF
jgi:hypothetical protein